MKRSALALRRFFGWLLIVLGIIWLIASVIASMVLLFSPDADRDFSERIFSFLLCILLAAVFFTIAYLGWNLQKKNETAVEAGTSPDQPIKPAPTAAPADIKHAQSAPSLPADEPSPEAPKPADPVDPALLDTQKLLIKLHAWGQLHPSETLDVALRKELAQKLLALDKLYLAMDEDFNRTFPFVANGGRVELFTCAERALMASRGFAERYGLHFIPKCFQKSEFSDMLRMMQFNGFSYLTVENGISPVQMRLSDFDPAPLDLPLVDQCNCDLRHMLIRNLEYGYRLRKLPAEDKTTSKEKELQEVMLTMEANGFQTLANSLLYVFGPGPRQKDVTFYTPRAMEKARQLLQEKALGEEKLCAEGTSSFQVYEGSRNLRVVNHADKPAQADGYVCAFTESRSACDVLHNFEKHGCDDNLLVITWEELAGLVAAECAGVVLDMPTYGYELPTQEFEKVSTYAAIPGRIIMSLNEKKEDDQSDAPTEESET